MAVFVSGPGCSSLGYGAFSELGPFFPSGDKLIANPYAWNTCKPYPLLHVPVPDTHTRRAEIKES